jgi:hypothetical protein
MSPEAVTARLKRASQLAALCLELSRATPVATAREAKDDGENGGHSKRCPKKSR